MVRIFFEHSPLCNLKKKQTDKGYCRLVEKIFWQLKINMYLCTLKTNKVMTTKNIISLHILPPSTIWFLGKNNFDERCPMATALSRFVAVGR